MNKFAVVLFTAAMTLGSSVAMANSNEDADAGAVAGSAKSNIAPNKVSNNNINTSDEAAAHKKQKHHKKSEAHKSETPAAAK
ncbi:MAG: hypothetical protein XXXJIFNMEKO3_00876 [Candidatus Erwinia impunctatus]|nr:hypothetical protein XXXJIFNMEKO_00876 [Culicoides impunctatus]